MTGKNNIIKAIFVGFSGTLGLLLFYFLLVGILSQSIDHVVELMRADRYYIVAISLGFGLQLGLHNYHKALIKECKDKAATYTTVAGTGSSTASMIACCVHHVADFAPLIASSGIAIFFNDYKYQIMTIGIAVNLLGITITGYNLYKHYRAHQVHDTIPG